MNFISRNPYRIIGVATNASSKDILKQKSRFLAYSRANKTITTEMDFTFQLSNLERNAEIIEQAFSSIELPEDKIFHSLFWFVNEHPIDNIALDHLKLGNIDKAMELWGKAINGKELTERNISAFNNLSTLNLLMGENLAIVDKLKLIEMDGFSYFSQLIIDENVNVNKESLIERILSSITLSYSNRIDDLEDYFKLILHNINNGYSKKLLIEKLTVDKIHEIENLIEENKNKCDAHIENSMLYAKNFLSSVMKLLKNIVSILGKNDIQVLFIRDKVAEELRNCVNKYYRQFNEEGDLDKEKLKKCLEVVNLAVDISNNSKLKNQLNEDKAFYQNELDNFDLGNDFKLLMEEIQGFKDNVKTSKQAYNFAVNNRNRLLNVKKLLGDDDDMYINISSAIVSGCLGVSIEEVNTVQKKGNSINYIKLKVGEAFTLLSHLKLYDMNAQVRQSLYNNLRVIEKMHNDLKSISSSSNYSTSSNHSNNDDNGGCLGLLFILGIIIVVANILGN